MEKKWNRKTSWCSVEYVFLIPGIMTSAGVRGVFQSRRSFHPENKSCYKKPLMPIIMRCPIQENTMCATLYPSLQSKKSGGYLSLQIYIYCCQWESITGIWRKEKADFSGFFFFIIVAFFKSNVSFDFLMF